MKLKTLFVVAAVGMLASSAHARVAGLRITNLSATAPETPGGDFEVNFDVELLSPASDGCGFDCGRIGNKLSWTSSWSSGLSEGSTWAVDPILNAVSDDGTWTIVTSHLQQSESSSIGGTNYRIRRGSFSQTYPAGAHSITSRALRPGINFFMDDDDNDQVDPLVAGEVLSGEAKIGVWQSWISGEWITIGSSISSTDFIWNTTSADSFQLTTTVTGPYGIQDQVDFVLCESHADCEAAANECETAECVESLCVFTEEESCEEEDGGPTGGDDDTGNGDEDSGPGDEDTTPGDHDVTPGDSGNPSDHDASGDADTGNSDEDTGNSDDDNEPNPSDDDTGNSDDDNEPNPSDNDGTNNGGDSDRGPKKVKRKASGCASTADAAQLFALVPWALLAIRRRRSA